MKIGFLVLIFFSLSSLAKGDTLSVDTKKHFFISVNASVEDCNVTYGYPFSSAAGYTAGANLCFQASKRVDLVTGIQYSVKGYSEDVYYHTYSTFETVRDYFWGIPFNIVLLSEGEDVSLYGGLGMTLYYYRGFHGGNNFGTSEMNIYSLITAGFRGKLNEKSYLAIGAEYSNFLLGTDYIHFWSIGLNATYYYRIK